MERVCYNKDLRNGESCDDGIVGLGELCSERNRQFVLVPWQTLMGLVKGLEDVMLFE